MSTETEEEIIDDGMCKIVVRSDGIAVIRCKGQSKDVVLAPQEIEMIRGIQELSMQSTKKIEKKKG